MKRRAPTGESYGSIDPPGPWAPIREQREFSASLDALPDCDLIRSLRDQRWSTSGCASTLEAAAKVQFIYYLDSGDVLRKALHEAEGGKAQSFFVGERGTLDEP